MDDEKFSLKVLSKEGPVFQGEVSSLTSYNEIGKFDVLARHENFISLIQKGLVIKEDYNSEEKKIDFDHALIRVKENSAEVYIGIEGISPI